MFTNPPPRIIKSFVKKSPKKIVLEPSKTVTLIPPRYEGAPLIRLYRQGGPRPTIRWWVSNPKPVGWLARRSNPRKEEKERKEEGRVKISLEWRVGRDRPLVRRLIISGGEGIEGRGDIRNVEDTSGPAPQGPLHKSNTPNQKLDPAASTAKLTANSATIASTTAPAFIQYRSIEPKASTISNPALARGAGGNGYFPIRKYLASGVRPIEYAPAPLPAKPEAAGPRIRKFLALDITPRVNLSRRVLYDANAQDGLRIRKCLYLSPEPKEPAPSAQRVLKTNLCPILTELPEGLSWDTVLALVLPEEHILRPRIDMLRRAYDRHYYQGKIPHMKLIYPFVNYPFDTSTSLTNTTIPISARLHHAISQHPPFPIHLTTLQRLGRAPCSTSLTNGRTLPLLSFHPSPASLPNLYSLQSSLRTAFSPEIDKVVAAGGDMSTGVLHLNSPPLLATGEWVGYVGLGAIKTIRKDLKEVKERFRRGLWGRKGVRAENMWEAARFGVKWDGKVKEMEEWEEMVGEEEDEFKWVVDRVSVLRRGTDWNGEEGLKVVGEFMLGGKADRLVSI